MYICKKCGSTDPGNHYPGCSLHKAPPKPMMGQFGMDVRMTLKWNGDVREQTLHNITEIHYNYRPRIDVALRIAFESDIHGTGMTYDIDQVLEFEAMIAKGIADSL